jgi:outer membrane protein assembly factor BamE (lipoprotein component of BamABCDE complex)
VSISAIKSFGRATSSLAAVLLVGTVIGCTGVTDTRGNFPLKEVVEEIKTGRHTQREIISMLGSPSTKATFEKKEFWYYIGEKTETLAFFKPKILERLILVIQFDKGGVVRKITKLGASAAKSIELVKRITPTKSKNLSVLQQILGNVGRFGKTGDDQQ